VETLVAVVVVVVVVVVDAEARLAALGYVMRSGVCVVAVVGVLVAAEVLAG